jgi:hypothetical protein
LLLDKIGETYLNNDDQDNQEERLNEDNDSPLLKVGISEGIVLGILTVVGYFCTYMYELGSKKFYSIPDTFVEIDLTSVIKLITEIWAYLIILLVLIIAGSSLFKFIINSESRIKFFLLALLCLTYIFLVMLFFHGFSMRLVKAMGFVLLGIITQGFLIPLITQWKIRGFRNKIRASSESELPPILGSFRRKYGSKALRIAMLIFLVSTILPIFQELGRKDAENEDTYQLTLINGEMNVLLGTFKDSMIIAPVDLASEEISPEFRFIKQRDDDISKIIKFETVMTGPLKVKEPRSVIDSVYKNK